MNGGIIPPTPFTKLLSKATLLSITSALGHGSLFSQATEPQQSATTHAVELPTELALPLSDDQHLTGDLSWESLSRRPHVGGEKMTGFCQVLRVEDAVPCQCPLTLRFSGLCCQPKALPHLEENPGRRYSTGKTLQGERQYII